MEDTEKIALGIGYLRAAAELLKEADTAIKQRYTLRILQYAHHYEWHFFRERSAPAPITYTCTECGQQFQSYRKKKNVLCPRCVYYSNIAKTSRRWHTDPEYRKSVVKSHKKRIKNWRELGLCVRCGKERLPDRQYCADCLEKFKNTYQARRKKWLEQGLCTMCGSPPLPGRKRCAKCSESQSYQKAKHRQEHPEDK